MADKTPAEQAAVKPTDIVFECPKCGKSLAIDPQGAGYVVTCPDCGSDMQVPESQPSQDEVSGLAASVEELRARAERLRSLDRKRFEEISAEIGLVQAAIDRIVAILQDAVAPAAERREDL
jgi:transcription initiation factor IIE alpha subunit